MNKKKLQQENLIECKHKNRATKFIEIACATHFTTMQEMTYCKDCYKYLDEIKCPNCHTKKQEESECKNCKDTKRFITPGGQCTECGKILIPITPPAKNESAYDRISKATEDLAKRSVQESLTPKNESWEERLLDLLSELLIAPNRDVMVRSDTPKKLKHFVSQERTKAVEEFKEKMREWISRGEGWKIKDIISYLDK